MVVYSFEEKVLIIPEGAESCDCSGGVSKNCEKEYRRGYDEGFEDGLEACSGSTPCDCTEVATEAYQEGYQDGLEACSGDTPCDCTEAYQEGVTRGMMEQEYADRAKLTHLSATTNGTYTAPYGYSEVVVNVPQSGGCNLQAGSLVVDGSNYTGYTAYPEQGYDGFSSFNVNASQVVNDAQSMGFVEGERIGRSVGYSSGYSAGYQAGVDSCPSCTGCNLYSLQYITTAQDTGHLSLYPDSEHNGFSFVGVNMDGFGQKMYDIGYQSGYTNGLQDCSGVTPSGCAEAVAEAYESGFSSGYSSSPNRSKVTFKLTNTIVLNGDLSALSLAVNGVPVEDLGAIFQTEEIHYFNHTTMWLSGYTQPGAITGVEITIREENLTNSESELWGDDWGRFVIINGREYESETNSKQWFDVVDNRNKSRRITYTFSDEILVYNDFSYNAGKEYGVSIAKPYGYEEGMNSVIKSVFDENDSDYIIAYYYTSASQWCLITGEYSARTEYYDGNECVSAMSINGGAWQPVEKYDFLFSGWTQIRFKLISGSLGMRALFSHRFNPSMNCYMDALKAVSIPSRYQGLGQHMFASNQGMRVLSSSIGVARDGMSMHNLKVIITHYRGNQREWRNFDPNGVFFIPAGTSADWTDSLTNWTHIEMFK